MDSNKIKHLEFIQAVINRHARSSFLYKGWVITLVAAIFVLSAEDPDSLFILIALLPTLIFWGLDAFYLRQERLFRALYDGVRNMEDSEWETDPFSMNTQPYNAQVASWLNICFSKSILPLYLLFTIVIAVIALIIYIDC